MNRRAAFAFAIAFATGAGIWALSPVLTGHSEPWDAEGFMYFGSLIVAGVVAGALAPRPLWAHYLGAVFGQLTYELVFLKLGPLVLIGALFLLGYSLLFLAGAAVAAHVRLHYEAGSSAA